MESLKYLQNEDTILADGIVIRNPELCKIGKHTAIDHGFYCTSTVEIGDYVHIGPYVCVIGGKTSKLKIGNFVAIAAGTKIICGSDNTNALYDTGLYGPASIPEKFRNIKNNKPVIIEDHVSIAVNAVIVPGVKLSEGCLIMPNTFVRKDTEPWTCYYGSPARVYRKRDPGDRYVFAEQLGYD